MKLIYDQTRDRKQLHSLVHHLLQTRKGQVLSGIKARQLFAEIYGLDIDHHEYANVLDEMSRREECILTKGNGDCEYLIN